MLTISFTLKKKKKNTAKQSPVKTKTSKPLHYTKSLEDDNTHLSNFREHSEN